MSAAEVGIGWIIGPTRLHRPAPNAPEPADVEGEGMTCWSACGLIREGVYSDALVERLYPRLPVCALCAELEQR